MPAEKVIVADSIVLKLTPTGEKFTQARILSPDLGLLSVLKRNQSKTNKFSIDLFDQGEAHVDQKRGESYNSGFLTDFVLTKKRTGLGKSYPALQAAAWISNLILSNPIHEVNQEDTFSLAQKAFDSLSDGMPPHSVLLKTLYVYARDEGYPVVEDWVRNLKTEFARKTTHVLNTPLTEISIGKDEQQASFESLALYLEINTHIHLPPR